MVEVPPVVRQKALVARATAWLSELPVLVERLESEWAMTVGRIHEDATEALVADVALDDGSSAVLKLVIPRHGEDSVTREITALRLADGKGCVTLIRADAELGALLLERLGRSLHDLGLPVRRRHEILCDAAQRVWRPVARQVLPSGAEKARWLAAFVVEKWEALGRPCSEAAVAHALACAGSREASHDDERALLVHGDVHEWNTLEAPGAPGGFKLVDPDGLLAEPEYDLGIVMREDPVELLEGDPRARALLLAARSGLDAEAIWEWGVVERVSTGLLATEIGLQPIARQMLAAAEAVAGT